MPEAYILPAMRSLVDASAESRLPVYTLRRMCLENKIAHVQSGNKYYINMESLCKYLNSNPQS